MKWPLGVGIVVALLAAGGALAWHTAARDREYYRLIRAGESAAVAGQTVLALEAFSGAIALKNEAMLGYLKRGETYRRAGDLTAAYRDLRRAAQLDPTATRVLEEIGDVHAAEARFVRAAERYTTYVRIDDRSPRVLYKLGLAHYQDGNTAAAIGPLRQAVQINDRFAEAYYLLGLCLRSQQQTTDAATALERAVRLAPGLTQPREALADLFRTLHRQRERLEQLEALVALEPERTGRHIALALARAEAGRTDLAVVALGRAAERHPDDLAIYSALGSVWLRMAEVHRDRAALNKALEAIRTVVASGRATADDYHLHGRALLLAGEPELAIRALRQATARLPVEPRAYERLAVAAERLGQTGEARDALVRYAALTRDEREQAAAALRIAALSTRLKEPAETARWLERAARLSPQDHALPARVAEAQLAAGAPAQARQTVQRALAAGIDTPALRRLTGVLAGTQGSGISGQRSGRAKTVADPPDR